MASLASAVIHAGIGLISYTTGLPVGDGVNAVKALLTRQRPPSLEALARRVETQLRREIAVEHHDEGGLAPVLATLDDLLVRHGPSLEVVVEQHRLREEAVATAVMADGASLLVGIDAGRSALIEKLLQRTYRHYLAERDLLGSIQRESLKALLAENMITREQLTAILAKLDALTRPAEAPAPPDSIPGPVGDFTGYADEIAAVKVALSGGGAVAVSAVQGMGGVGKSQLAYKVAAELAEDFPDGRIFVDMLGTTAQARTATDAMTSVLGAFGVKDILPNDREAEYRRLLAGKRVLVLLDNVASRAGLDRLVPPGPSAMLVTSRAGLALDGAPTIELERLSRVAAKALLGSILPSLDDASRGALAQLCADLPLALRVAGTYLKATRYPVDAYVEELAGQRLARLAESGRDLGDDTLNPEIVLGHSYDLLADAEPELAWAFTLLGVFPAGFEVEGAVAVLDGEARTVRRQLGRLVERGLLQTPTDGRFRLHDLLRELANVKADSTAKRAAAARHRGHYLALLAWAEREVRGQGEAYRAALGDFERELANVRAAALAAEAAGDREDAAPAHGRLGNILKTLGRREEAHAATEEAVAVYRELAAARPDTFRPDLASALNNLGNKLDALGRREDALVATEESVALNRDLAAVRLDAFRPDLASALNNLGTILDALGRREDALAATKESVAVYRKLVAAWPDAFRPGLAAALNNLGVMFNTPSRRADALAATQEAVAVYRELAEARPEAFRPDLAASLNNLGNRLNGLGRREDALRATEEAVAIHRSLAQDRPDAFNPDLALSLAVRANCLEGLDRHGEALGSNVEAIEALRTTFLRHPRAVIQWMRPMCQQYVERCQKLCVEPDAELLGPIVEVFERLKNEGG